jgi:hypothetical protein
LYFLFCLFSGTIHQTSQTHHVSSPCRPTIFDVKVWDGVSYGARIDVVALHRNLAPRCEGMWRRGAKAAGIVPLH